MVSFEQIWDIPTDLEYRDPRVSFCASSFFRDVAGAMVRFVFLRFGKPVGKRRFARWSDFANL
jgi:hypothetical protein